MMYQSMSHDVTALFNNHQNSSLSTIPDLSRQADSREKHSFEVEITKESLDEDAIDCERDLRYAEIKADAYDITSLERLLGCSY